MMSIRPKWLIKSRLSMALQDAVRKAKPIILEPVMNVEVVCPEIYMGNVVGDLESAPGQNQWDDAPQLMCR